MLYQYMYSVNGTMTGYTEHSLAYFNVSNFQPGSAPTSTLIKGVSMCRSELSFIKSCSSWLYSINGFVVTYRVAMCGLLRLAKSL